jgi:hypothetical protein
MVKILLEACVTPGRLPVDWCVPLLLDERVDIVFCVKIISCVIIFIY